jgi:putative methyltransferase (TIGR04325 family)
MNAPIVLFVYARPAHTRRTVEALLDNLEAAESDLVVFSDAAGSADEADSVRSVREYVSRVEGFRSLVVHHREQNLGLARSIISGVTQVLSEHQRVIVLEDDMITSPYFLRYMNEALERYADDDRVISVHGYVFPVTRGLPEAFFLRGADCWGWATWRRGWELFNPDGQHLLDELKRRRMIRAFDFNGAYGFSDMLKGQIEGTNDSWAVRWYASAFLANKLTLYPGRSLVHNIGNESSGTHCGSSTAMDTELSTKPILLSDLVVEESAIARKSVEAFYRTTVSPFLWRQGQLFPFNLRKRLIALARDWLPPALARNWARLLRRGQGNVFEGPFASWAEAAGRSTGYDSKQILERVLAATLEVKHGRAVFERDSVLFDEIQYAWPVTAGLMCAAARYDGRLRVLDFGGALGSSYFQNRSFLHGLKRVRWAIVEQPHFVQAGREHIQDDDLVFYPTIGECAANENPNVVLLSGVLQYLDRPYAILQELIECGAEFVIVDRTSFHDGRDDLVAMQTVPPAIYSASYPMWLLSRHDFMRSMSSQFDLVAESLSPEGYISLRDSTFSFNGFIFRRRPL